MCKTPTERSQWPSVLTFNREWCVDNNGDHGGMFSYRICQDQQLVNKLITPGYIPTQAEKQAAEACFEAGTLDCTDVPGQTCGINPDCQDSACKRTDWFTCNAFQADSRRACQGVDGSALGSCKTTIAGGYTVTKKIKIPDYVSEHTLLSFKWNSWQTPQIYLGCADIAIKGSGTTPPSSSTTSKASTTTSTKTTTSSTSTATNCPAKVAVTFSETRTTNYGETVKVVGSIAELGNWNAQNAPSLSATGYTASNPVWKQTIQLPAGSAITYKFAIVSSSGAVTWESDPNRSYTVPACQQSAEVSATWR